jgi:HSP20 family protein
MVLSRWSPFTTVASLFEGWEPFTTPVFRAPVDVLRTDDGYRFQAALPGYKPEEVQVTLENGTLTIAARRSEENRTERAGYLRREVYAGSFQRRFSLPAEVGADDIRVTLDNGMLSVDVKYAPARRAVTIPVGAAALPEQTAQTGQSEVTGQAEQPAA